MILRISATILLLLSLLTQVLGKCSLPQVKTPTPSENDGAFLLSLATNNETEYKYLPDQTYVLTLSSKDPSRTFRWFMITAEDPDADNQENYRREPADTGSLKPLDGQTSRYSERCPNSVENSDNTEKTNVEIHWISPKKNADTKNVRISAIVAKNEEVWYTGENLTVMLHKDDGKLLDSPPLQPVETCNLCSEAQYEVIFKGKWSRLTHPRHFPSVPDENGYSHMVGASHAFNYTLWDRGVTASEGLKQVAETGNIAIIERDIIDAMSVSGGTRTLIRGKKSHHPHMFEPSYSLLRVDRIHHLFSLVVSMRPSPDWFLGVAKFELCTPDGWFEHAEIPLYPWDAGTDEGISYKSPKSPMSPADTVERVAVGSFDKASPFFQLNLNALKPFAFLEVRRLNVYPVSCGTEETVEPPPAESNVEAEAEAVLEPLLAESKADQQPPECTMEWSEWNECQPFQGSCGPGVQIRTQQEAGKTEYYDKDADEIQLTVLGENCQRNDEVATETRPCYVNCL